MRKFIPLALLILTGCQTAPKSAILYSPQGISEIVGTYQVETFVYTPSERIAPNQIENTAIGNIYLQKEIGETFSNAVKQELRSVGASLKGTPDCTITGTVSHFKADDLGFEVDFTLTTSYVLSKNGAPLHEKTVHSEVVSTKGNGLLTIGKIIGININEFLSDPDVTDETNASCN